MAITLPQSFARSRPRPLSPRARILWLALGGCGVFWTGVVALAWQALAG